MTDPARRRNIADSLARAAQALALAEAALGIGARWMPSRAPTMQRCISCALCGSLAASIRGLPATTNRLLAALQRQRELADYDSATVFDADDVRQQIDEVKRFGTSVTTWLRSERWLDA